MATTTAAPRRGYIEGYYARVLTWAERETILASLARHRFDDYLYAPKSDPCHRRRWRDDHGDDWHRAFARFCAVARDHRVTVTAGIAPGFDFDYAAIDGGGDLERLVEKCRRLAADGADRIALMLDDIDPVLRHRGRFVREGDAHATLANRLSVELGAPVELVPRVYATEIIGLDPDDRDAPDYWDALAATLEPSIPVYWCGRYIVDHAPGLDSLHALAPGLPNPVVLWDNLYANDYCPRRLFTGPWIGRPLDRAVLMNPTGYPATDRLLIDLMGSAIEASDGARTVDSRRVRAAREAVLRAHQIPSAFDTLSPWFDRPPRFDDHQRRIDSPPSAPDRDALAALDTCLWEWTGELAREWYPWLMGFRQDVLLALGELPPIRIHKTQTAPLGDTLLSPPTARTDPH